VVIVRMVVMSMVVMGRCRVRAVPMPVIVMLNFVAARIARMRAEYGDQAGQNGAQQRQKNDCLNHSCA
jgi:hypothetical protein